MIRYVGKPSGRGEARLTRRRSAGSVLGPSKSAQLGRPVQPEGSTPLLYWIVIILLVLFAAFMVMRSRARR
jgi:hypothetical protein